MFQLPSLILAILALNTAAGDCPGQSVAYRTHGTGVYAPATGDYSGPGFGTHLGYHTFVGNIAVFPTADPLDFTFVGTVPQDTVAADGSRLFFGAAGQVELIPLDASFTTFTAIWTGEFTVEGGTGRFAGAGPADEPLHVVAINEPFRLTDPIWAFSWELSGRIVLR